MGFPEVHSAARGVRYVRQLFELNVGSLGAFQPEDWKLGP